MYQRCPTITLLLLTVVTRSGLAQGKLEWKFKPGDKFSAKMATSYKGKVVLHGETHEQEAENNTVLAFTVLKRNGDSFVLQAQVQSVKVTSSGGSTGFPQIPLAGKWRRATFRITLALDGEITRFGGYEAALKQIAGNSETVIKRMRSLFPEDYFKQLAGAVFTPLPKGEIKKDGAWELPVKVYLPPWGRFEGTARFADQGKAKEGERIHMTAGLKYVAPPANAIDAPFKILSGELKAEPARGTFLFDPVAGRLIRSETKVQFKGALVFGSEDQKIPIRLEQEKTVVIRLQN
jgi:hypothetical protein